MPAQSAEILVHEERNVVPGNFLEVRTVRRVAKNHYDRANSVLKPTGDRILPALENDCVGN